MHKHKEPCLGSAAALFMPVDPDQHGLRGREWITTCRMQMLAGGCSGAADRVEVLAMAGAFGSLLSVIQATLVERHQILNIAWTWQVSVSSFTNIKASLNLLCNENLCTNVSWLSSCCTQALSEGRGQQDSCLVQFAMDRHDSNLCIWHSFDYKLCQYSL